MLAVATMRAKLQRETSAHLTWSGRLRGQVRELANPLSRRAALGIAAHFLAIFGIALLFEAVQPTFLPELRPLPTHDGLGVLWQVQTGLAAVALPLLFALMPVIRTSRVSALSMGELLMAETYISPILAFALSGVLWTGIAALWFDQSAAVWLAVLLVLVPTLLGVGYVYVTAASLLYDPTHLRRASSVLLSRRVSDSVVQQAAIEYANGALVQALDERGIGVYSWELRHEPDAIHIGSDTAGVLMDVDLDALRTWIDELPRREASLGVEATSQPGADPQSVPFVPEPERTARDIGTWNVLIGDRVGPRTRVVSLRHEEFARLDLRVASAQLGKLLRVTRDD